MSLTVCFNSPAQPLQRGFFHGVSPSHIWTSSSLAAFGVSQHYCLFQRTCPLMARPKLTVQLAPRGPRNTGRRLGAGVSASPVYSTALGVSCSDSVTRSLALMPVTHPTQQARFTMPVLWVLPVLRSPQHESAPPGLLLLSKKRQYYSATSNVSINFKELTATP